MFLALRPILRGKPVEGHRMAIYEKAKPKTGLGAPKQAAKRVVIWPVNVIYAALRFCEF